MENPKITTETGVTYIANLNGYSGYHNSDVDAEKLHKLRGNIHGGGPVAKLLNQIFPDDPTVEAVDKVGDPAPELEAKLTAMVLAQPVDIPTRMRQAFMDRCWAGASIQNQVWDYDSTGTLVLQKLNWLPPHSFNLLPPGRPTIFSPIMLGVQLNPETKEIEYWQRQGLALMPVQLDSASILMITDPTDGELAGDPLMRPVAPILEMLAFVYNTTMQWINQLAIRPMFLKITNPQKASPKNDMVGDVEYGDMVLANYGKDNRYPLRENMEPIWPSGADTSQDIVRILEYLVKQVTDYLSPSNQISKDGPTIGGSSAPEFKLLQTYIRGHHKWIEAGFNPILQKYCDENGWTDLGYSARFRIPTPDQDQSELHLKQAMELRAGKTGSRNEHRVLCGEDTITDEELDANAEAWTAQESQPAPFSFTNLTHKATVDPSEHEKIAGKTFANLETALDKLKSDVIAGVE